MERCDVVDEFGVRTGRVVTRGSTLAPGEYYPVVHVWIRDEQGRYLIQQRALNRVSSPGVWATTVGYVLAGEDSLAGAVREVQEELGLTLLPEQLRRWAQIKYENLFEDIWLAVVASDTLDKLVLGPEVAAWMLASKTELAQRINRGEFFGYSYFTNLPE